jgi:hypothetical protein
LAKWSKNQDAQLQDELKLLSDMIIRRRKSNKSVVGGKDYLPPTLISRKALTLAL